MTDETTSDAGLGAADVGTPTRGAELDGVETPAGDAETPDRTGRRGSLVVYAVAFGLMLLAGVCLVVAELGTVGVLDVAEESLLGTQRVLRVSSVLSGLAIAAAVVAVLVPKRRP